MKNYYDELEVSKTASKEVIEKVYKVLAKKYHPDTTKEIDKQAAEEKFKIISEAYEILSDDEKRKKYDLEFEESNPTISYEEYINVVNQRDSLNNAFNNLKNEFYQFKDSFNIGTQSQYNMHQYDNTNINNGYNFLEMLFFSLGSSLGFVLVLYIFSSIRETLDKKSIHKSFKGFPIAMITIGIMALLFGRLILKW